MSQMQLAEMVGVSYQQIQKYEKGLSEISLSRLYQIADALNINPINLLPLREDKVGETLAPYGELSRDEAMLLNLFREIKDKRIKDSLLRLIKGICDTKKKKPKSKAS